MLGTHLLGIYEKALHKSDIRTKLEKAKELGFDFLEMSIDESDEKLERLYYTQEQRDEIKQAIADTGIPIKTICLSGHRRYPMGSADPKVLEKSKEIMERCVYFAEEIGTSIIMLAGYDVYYEPSSPETIARFLESLKWAAKLAGDHQIMLGVEVMDTELINTITKYLEWEKKIDSPWFRVYPDMGNINAWGIDVPSEIRVGARHCVGMHVKDTRNIEIGKPGVFRDIPFGEGTTDFVGCFKAMEEYGFSGVCVMEMWDTGNNDMEEIAKAKKFVEEKFRLATVS